MIARLPYSLYVRMVMLKFWLTRVLCTFKGHNLYVEETAREGAERPGYGCFRCDWWSVSQFVRRNAKRDGTGSASGRRTLPPVDLNMEKR